MESIRYLYLNGTYYRADGYYAPTKTIYEYYGDFWHGNPTVFNLNESNNITHKTFGQLYQYTIEKKFI